MSVWFYLNGCTYTVHTITNILSQNKSQILHFFLFLYDVCQKYIVRNSKSNDKERKPTQ